MFGKTGAAMRNSPSLRYLAASLALGAIAVWGSENLFWSAPPDDISPGILIGSWLIYSFCVAAVLSAVLLTGILGWRALFLGGALLGWLVEGVVVDTSYDAFPWQLVWTALAWHALITCLFLGGLCRRGPHLPLGQQIGGLILFGLLGACFAVFWPIERVGLAELGPGAELGYLVGFGIAVPLANLALDRLGTVTAPPRWLLWAAPFLLGLLWVVKTALAPSLIRPAVPLLIGVTLWAMWRLGSRPAGGTAPIDFGPPVPLWRHALFLLAPLITSVLAVLGWQMFPAGLATNVVFALATSSLALGLWLWSLAAALRPRGKAGRS